MGVTPAPQQRGYAPDPAHRGGHTSEELWDTIRRARQVDGPYGESLLLWVAGHRNCPQDWVEELLAGNLMWRRVYYRLPRIHGMLEPMPSPRLLRAFAANPHLSPELLNRIWLVSDHRHWMTGPLTVLVLNPATPEQVIEAASARVVTSESLLSYELACKMLLHPNLTATACRRLTGMVLTAADDPNLTKAARAGLSKIVTDPARVEWLTPEEVTAAMLLAVNG